MGYTKEVSGKTVCNQMQPHSLMDNDVPVYKAMLVLPALEKANKVCDLIVFPNSAHGYGAFAPYMMRRRWDYFIKNLMGAEPPHEYELKTKTDPRNGAE